MSSRRRTARVALLAVTVGLVGMWMTPAQAADDKPDLTVSIRSLSPSALRDGSTIRMAGTVTNHNTHAWTDVQAYLVIPTSPFTTRAQIDRAIADGNSYAGVRIADLASIDEMGDLAAGATTTFRVAVPWAKLGLSGAEGVYPVGVQILGTDDEGQRDSGAIGRATTFLPLISDDRTPAPASVVWPFLMPDYRGADGDYEAPKTLLSAVSTGGRLRNLLDLAAATSGPASTVLIDPALLVGVDDLANDRDLPDSFAITEIQQLDAARFLADLLTLGRGQSCWILGYDRPDVLALSQARDLRAPLLAAVESATQTALTTYQITGRRVAWPTREGVTRPLLEDLRGDGDSPVLVNAADLPGWGRRDGSVVQYATERGPVPLLVNDVLDAGVPGQDSVVTLRQRILSDAALAVLQRAADDESRADAVTVVDPQWNPGNDWRTGQLTAAFTAPFSAGSSLDSRLTRPLTRYDGKIAAAKASPISRAQLRAAADILLIGDTLTSVVPQSNAVDEALSRDIASAVAVRWRRDRSEGLTIARARAAQTGAELDKITIEGPPSVTLSSSKGGFPLTISNDTDEAIRIGVSLGSSNPALTIPDVEPIDIGAGERHTLTVDVDLGRQNTTTVTALLRSTEGDSIGDPAVFNVRSSKVGIVLWVAMGLAGLLVLASLVRRFRRHRTRVTSERLADDDD